MMIHIRFALLSPLLSTILASPVPDHGLSRLTKPTFGLDSVHLNPAPGLPPLESLPGITIDDLLKPPHGIRTRDYVEEESLGVSLSDNPLLARAPHCFVPGFPLTFSANLATYMWEPTAVRVVYNYLRLLGQTICVVPPEGAVLVDGWVNGYFVQVLGVSKWGIQEPGGKTVASYCEHVALGMESFLVNQGGGCLYPFDGHQITGGAGTAWGNGDFTVRN
ncbi:hypothetical protein QBC39DRAFT_430851 [Podospora conica]|nr:hypothetical protein QBC39DRAFT_430851 [Schizothecium conicum]